jgi:hypothetical protein
VIRARARGAAAACLALALPLVVAAAARAGPGAEASLSHRLLVNGDSLAVGTRPYLPRELRSWRVVQSVAVSRHAPAGAVVMRSYGSSLPRVIHVSLGTNDDPRAVSSFRASIRAVMDVAGPQRCVVWTNIVRPAVAGTSYAGYNRALAEESRSRDNLIVVNWARMVRRHPQWVGEDGVHVSPVGYQARAHAVARSVRRCR